MNVQVQQVVSGITIIDITDKGHLLPENQHFHYHPSPILQQDNLLPEYTWMYMFTCNLRKSKLHWSYNHNWRYLHVHVRIKKVGWEKKNYTQYHWSYSFPGWINCVIYNNLMSEAYCTSSQNSSGVKSEMFYNFSYSTLFFVLSHSPLQNCRSVLFACNWDHESVRYTE